jgi:RNase P/RNase MRP subunit POP5
MKLRRLPSMREKRHYLIFRLHSDMPVPYEDMKGAVMNSILNWMGEKGFSMSNAKIIRNLWDGRRQEGWLSCTPKSVDDAKMSLALIHQVGDAKVIFQVLRVSGTIKSGKGKIS